jgi:Metallo-beta-lactamase superfamily
MRPHSGSPAPAGELAEKHRLIGLCGQVEGALGLDGDRVGPASPPPSGWPAVLSPDGRPAGPSAQRLTTRRQPLLPWGLDTRRLSRAPVVGFSPMGDSRPMVQRTTGEIIEGLWRFEALHPEWTEDEGEDGWEQQVAWWAVSTPHGLVVIDPLVDDWDALDQLVAARGGCAGIVRTCHWHQRSVSDVASRYSAEVWAKQDGDGRVPYAFDRATSDRDELLDVLRVFDVERADEIAVWLPRHAALVFADAMIRTRAGDLRVCPESWTQPEGGPARLRTLLRALTVLPIEHVLVSHGPLVLGGGGPSLRTATS